VTTPRVSIIVPVYNEGDLVVPLLDRLLEAVSMPCEVLAVFDSMDDTTRPYLEDMAAHEPRLVPTLNAFEPGPAHALRYGFSQAKAPVIVVTTIRPRSSPWCNWSNEASWSRLPLGTPTGASRSAARP
jgi:glycosyltransferase involved in cell wall biosynthesis